MGYEQDLADRYAKLYEAQKNNLKTKLDNDMFEVQNAENQTNTNYTNLLDNLNKLRDSSKQQFYTDRNSVDTLYNTQVNNNRERAAMNGWRGGELAQLGMNADNNRINKLGTVQNQENTAIQGFNTQQGQMDREKANKLNEYASRRTLLNQNYNNEDTALKNQLEAQRMQELEQYQNQMRSMASRGSGGSGGGSGKAPSASQYTNMAWSDFEDFEDPSDRLDWLEANRSDIIQNAGHDSYTKMLTEAKKRYDQYGGYRDRRSNNPTQIFTNSNTGEDYIIARGGRRS
jgi:hypothetical protein